MSKINVYPYEESNEVIARVNYNNDLDYWDGSNYTNGGVGMHKGITRLKDGRYVIIYGSQWQGSRDYGLPVSDKEALNEILNSDNEELLENPRFAKLKQLAIESGLYDSEG